MWHRFRQPAAAVFLMVDLSRLTSDQLSPALSVLKLSVLPRIKGELLQYLDFLVVRIIASNASELCKLVPDFHGESSSLHRSSAGQLKLLTGQERAHTVADCADAGPRFQNAGRI